MSTENTAAWLVSPKAVPLEVGPAPYPRPRPDQLVVRTYAVAINPIDWMLQYHAFMPQNYPTVLGQDVAGEVMEVGSEVKGFQRGDRVIGHTVALASGESNQGGFQQYTLLFENLVCHIPNDLTFEEGCVIPLGFSTAACGLYLDDYLKLDMPSSGRNRDINKGALILWGGATSVGFNAIQLATASGYSVYATASPANFANLKSLGAVELFDYRSELVVEDMISAVRGQTLVGGLDCVNKSKSTEKLAKVLKASNVSGSRLFISTVLPNEDSLPPGVETLYIHGAALRSDFDRSKALYGDFLPESLANGSYKAVPTPQIVGQGLEKIQEALDLQRKGVSAAKIVVSFAT